MDNGRVFPNLVGDLRLKITHRRIGNILARLCRNGKAANIFLREKARRQRFKEEGRGSDGREKRRKHDTPVGKAPADRAAITTQRAFEPGIEPANDRRRSGSVAGEARGEHGRHRQ